MEGVRRPRCSRWLTAVMVFLCLGGSPPAQPADAPAGVDTLAAWEELAFWDAIKHSKNPDEYKAYLTAYPRGRFAAIAKLRLRELGGGAAATTGSVQRGGPSGPGGKEGRSQSLGVGPATAAGHAASVTGHNPGETFSDCADCPQMVVIPSGSFIMGSNHNRPDERPQHKVTIDRAFAIGAYEITNSEWDACVREAACRYSPRRAEEGRLPIGNVSWDDAEQYVHWLSGKAGGHYRLPTEAEWEYAARAGTRTTYWWGDAKGSGRANCSNCATSWDGKGKSPVGSFSPNPFGLYDMNGNLWEWTADCWNRSYNGAPTDGSAWIHGQCLSRVLRGGCWNLGADYMRSARRGTYDRDVRYYLNGFRVAKDLD